MADYADTTAVQIKNTAANSGKQAGDPVRVAAEMLDLTLHARPPLHLVLGAWGFKMVTGKLRERLDKMAAWRNFSLGVPITCNRNVVQRPL